MKIGHSLLAVSVAFFFAALTFGILSHLCVAIPAATFVLATLSSACVLGSFVLWGRGQRYW